MRARRSNHPDRNFDPQLLAELHLLEAAIGGDSLLDYIPRASPVMPMGVAGMRPNHLKVLADAVAMSEYEPVRLAFSVPPRHGKQIADSCPVLTPDGWRTHGDLQPGDRLYAVDGSITRVTGRHGGLVCDLELVTSDGEVITTHAEHLWTVIDRGSGAKPTRVMSTAQLVAAGLSQGAPGRRGSRWRFQLPNTGVLRGAVTELPFEPYFLGLWLGDGSSDCSKISMAPADAVECMGLLEDRGHRLGAWWRHATTGVISWVVKGTGVGRYFRGRKRVPSAYMRAAEGQRRELLRGLVDSDGSVEPGTGRVRVVGADRRLIEQVAVLARTLGYRAHVHRQEPVQGGRGIRGTRPIYTAQWTPHDGERQAHLSRKDVRSRVHAQRMRAVVDVRPASRPEVGHCVAVDHPSHTYLVGERLVPTHNTELISHAISWYLGRHPEHTVAYVSYSADVAGGKSIRVRDLAEAGDVSMRSDLARASEWRTMSGGGLLATGVGGPLTSHGCNLLIIDDPLKNREEAESQNQRQKVWEWFTSTAMSRLTPHGSVIVIHTRWHQDDLIGRLKKKGGWNVVNIPAVDAAGGALWPELWPKDVLDKRRVDVGEYDWWSLYMGEPRPRGAQLFEAPTFYDKPAVLGAKIVIACDPAATAKTHADYSVIVVGACWMGADGLPCVDVLDVQRVQVEIPTLVRFLAWEQRKWRAPIVVEAAGGFKAVPQTLRTMLKGVRIVEITPTLDKFTRALPCSAAWNAGRIRVPGKFGADGKTMEAHPDKPWLSVFLEELGEFTGVADDHDDQVDALAHLVAAAAAMLGARGSPQADEVARYLPFG